MDDKCVKMKVYVDSDDLAYGRITRKLENTLYLNIMGISGVPVRNLTYRIIGQIKEGFEARLFNIRGNYGE